MDVTAKIAPRSIYAVTGLYQFGVRDQSSQAPHGYHGWTCSSPVVRGGRTWDVLAVADIPAWGLIHCSRSSREGSEILDGNRANGYSTGSGEEVEEGKVDILSTRF